VGKRWNDPDYLLELAEADGLPERIPFWRSPVFRIKLQRVPAFLVPRLAELETEVPSSSEGKALYYGRVSCLLTLAVTPRPSSTAEPPTEAERELGHAIGSAFYHGCSLADIAFATGLPPEQVVAIGRRTLRRTKWLSHIGEQAE
jgi:hypothetical protein